MPDKIIISFDDEEEEPAKPLPVEHEQVKVEKIVPVDSYAKGSRHLNKFYNSPLEFPSGIDKSFYLESIVNLKDEFLNSILETSRHILLSSVRGSIYFVNKNTLSIDERFNYKEQSFEKTGIVIQDVAYINSLDKIYKISEMTIEEIYVSGKGFYIWSDLNYDSEIIYFEFNPVSMTVKFHGTSGTIDFSVRELPASDIVVNSNYYAMVAGNELIIINKYDNEIQKFNIAPSDENILFQTNGKIFFTQNNDEIYYINNGVMRYSGIKNRFMNSAAAVGNLIFTGNLNGWDAFTLTGNVVFSHSENFPCVVPALSENIICISMGDDLLLHNMHNLSEAENIYIKNGNGIISVMISRKAIYALTKNGILALINNSKINIKI